MDPGVGVPIAQILVSILQEMLIQLLEFKVVKGHIGEDGHVLCVADALPVYVTDYVAHVTVQFIALLFQKGIAIVTRFLAFFKLKGDELLLVFYFDNQLSADDLVRIVEVWDEVRLPAVLFQHLIVEDMTVDVQVYFQVPG